MEAINKHYVDEGLLKGRWKMIYKLTNKLKEDGFGGRTIGNYRDPITGKGRVLENAAGEQFNGYTIDRTYKLIDTSSDPDMVHFISWLIGHPRVRVMNDTIADKIDKRVLAAKDTNPRIELTNIDHEKIDVLEDQDFIDKLVGRVSEDMGSKAIGLTKIRWIMSAMDKVYRESRYYNDKTREKMFLRDKLKKYIRSSKQNAEEVAKIIDDLDFYRATYEIKEMMRFNIINVSGGQYLYQGNPLGIDFNTVRRYFDNSPDLYNSLLEKLQASQKHEQYELDKS